MRACVSSSARRKPLRAVLPLSRQLAGRSSISQSSDCQDSIRKSLLMAPMRPQPSKSLVDDHSLLDGRSSCAGARMSRNQTPLTSVCTRQVIVWRTGRARLSVSRRRRTATLLVRGRAISLLVSRMLRSVLPVIKTDMSILLARSRWRENWPARAVLLIPGRESITRSNYCLMPNWTRRLTCMTYIRQEAAM
jgi:hypothetical protein